MIPGLDRFRDRYSGHFRGLEASYLLIGGGVLRPRRTTPKVHISRESTNNRQIKTR
jgi:hypothetical protein